MVAAGQVLFTSPGEVRQLRVSGLEGLCLFFTGAFLERFFSDPLFLYRLPYFHRGAPAPALAVQGAERHVLGARLTEMSEDRPKPASGIEPVFTRSNPLLRSGRI